LDAINANDNPLSIFIGNSTYRCYLKGRTVIEIINDDTEVPIPLICPLAKRIIKKVKEEFEEYDNLEAAESQNSPAY